MNEVFVSAFGCIALGLLATIHPCPMTTNIAAISMIVGAPVQKHSIFRVILFFGFGYMISLICIALLINVSITSIPKVSLALQNGIALFLGPILILVGMINARLLKLDRFSANPIKSSRLSQGSIAYIFMAGLVLALAFCPATASIYFGLLIPLSIKFNQTLLFPMLYATGGFLPIAAIGFLMKKGGERIMSGKWTQLLTSISGYILIVIGIYISIQRLYL
jgi:cytochrome c-type biogenesis protein